jgi:hypothetical protein
MSPEIFDCWLGHLLHPDNINGDQLPSYFVFSAVLILAGMVPLSWNQEEICSTTSITIYGRNIAADYLNNLERLELLSSGTG